MDLVWVICDEILSVGGRTRFLPDVKGQQMGAVPEEHIRQSLVQDGLFKSIGNLGYPAQTVGLECSESGSEDNLGLELGDFGNTYIDLEDGFFVQEERRGLYWVGDLLLRLLAGKRDCGWLVLGD